MLGFLWPTEFLVFSDFLVAQPHAHGALQLSVGIEGSPRVRLDGAWSRTRGVLIDTDVAHAFDCDGQLTAIGWIEGRCPRLTGQLRDRVLRGGQYARLAEPLCDHLADELRPAFGKATGCCEAYKRWRDALGWLAIDVTPEPEYDRPHRGGPGPSAHNAVPPAGVDRGPHAHRAPFREAGSGAFFRNQSASLSAGICCGTGI